jgi:uncharacterized damage-inducible protein DinB
MVTESLSNTDIVLHALLENIESGDPIWDVVVDPKRFTLRQILAHLAEWDAIWLDRLKRSVAENRPQLPDIDEGELAQKHEYEKIDPFESLNFFSKRRKKTASYIAALPVEAWSSVSIKGGEEWTIANWITQIAAHDSYHLAQVAQWVKRLR